MLRSVSCLLLVLMTAVVTNDAIPIFGIVGRSIRLPCDIAIAEVANVEWSDMVYTSDSNPLLIFRSENNPDFSIETSHQNHLNYDIGSDFALTIDKLDVDADPGQYTCRSIVDGTVYEKEYYLTVGDLPACSGNVDLAESEMMQLECEMRFSGQQPSLQWFQSGIPTESKDEYDIRLAKQVVSLVASHSHDKTKFMCRMSLGDTTKECSLVLNVTYLVRDVRFQPEKEKFRVGDELRCSAKGNPVPSITLLPETGQGKAGHGWQSLTIGSNWEGQKINVQCTASNSVGSTTETLSSNATIHVTAQRKLQTTAYTQIPVEERHTVHHHVRHTSLAPPTASKKDKEHSRTGGSSRKHHHSHQSTTASMVADDEIQKRPAADNGKELNRNPVTYEMLHTTKTSTPVVETMDKNGKQGTRSDATSKMTGAKPVKGTTNEAGQIQHLAYSRAAVILLICFTLTALLI